MRLGTLLLFLATTAFAQAPHIDSITPSQGPIAGGTFVTISGTNLSGGVVTVDDALAGPASVTDSQISFQMPPHDNGYAIVRVLATSGTAATTFLYMPPALRDLPPGFITTVAGVGTYRGDYGPAIDAIISAGQIGYAIDGTLYISDVGQHRIVRVRPDGILEPYAFDLVLTLAPSMVVEPSGDIEIADAGTNRIWRISVLTGQATLLAGTGDAGFSGDGGPATAAQLNAPTFMAGDKLGSIWFLDSGNARVRRIDPDGTITTIAGTGTPGYSGDNDAAIRATFDAGFFGQLAHDDGGKLLYLADNGNHCIRRIDLTHNIITTFVGPTPDMTVGAMIVAPNGDLYANENHHILHLTRDGTLLETFGSDVNAMGFELDHEGNLLESDFGSNAVVRFDNQVHAPTTLVNANGVAGVFGENGPALAASLIDAGVYRDVAVNAVGEVIFSGPVIRKIGLDGKLSVVYGASTSGIDIDPAGNLDAAILTDVVQIDRSGNVHVVAGASEPWDVVADRNGNLFVADAKDNVVRRFDASTGARTIVAGNGQRSFCGDGGPATQACLAEPVGVAVTPAGELFIAEGGRVRKVDLGGTISTVTGIAGNGFLAADAAGCVYTTQPGGVVRVTPRGVVQRLAGQLTGERGFGGDGGPATNALLSAGGGIAIDGEGNLFFVDGNNARIRAVRFGAVLAPAGATIAASASGTTIRATVLDANGIPAPSVRVDFATPASGASCTPSSSFAITDANGIAAVSCTPNCLRGTYSVTATPLASPARASLSLTNESCHQRATRH